jgi:hypothetical protein
VTAVLVGVRVQVTGDDNRGLVMVVVTTKRMFVVVVQTSCHPDPHLCHSHYQLQKTKKTD